MSSISHWIAVFVIAFVAENVRSQEQPQWNIDKLDQGVSAFGGKENEERLRKIIHDTVVPPPRKAVPNTPADELLLRWSEPVGGLAARVEYASPDVSGSFAVLVRLKNVSTKPLTVPTGNPSRGGKIAPFRLYIQATDGRWKQRAWDFEPASDKVRQQSAPDSSEVYPPNTGNRFARPMVTLKPGESSLAYLCGSDRLPAQDGAFEFTPQIKVVLNVPATPQKDGWTGTVETSPYPTHAWSEVRERLAGRLPCPEHLPELNRHRAHVTNESFNETDVTRLWWSNLVLLSDLELYEPAGVRREFEKRMLAEQDFPMKLLVATVASAAGSEQAALFLLESMKSTKYEIFTNVHEALQLVIMAREAEPPDWIIRLIETAIKDDRYADLSKAKLSSSGPLRISFFSEHLLSAPGFAKSRKSVPFLIEMVKRTNGRRPGAVAALSRTGDPRAIPILIECLKRAGKSVKPHQDQILREEFSQPMDALAEMKVREAVPTLLEHLEFPEVIEALEKLGDPRALPEIRKLVASQGKLVTNGKAATSARDQERWFAARVAEAVLTGDAVPPLCAMIGDRSLDADQRTSLIRRLVDRNDPRAIATLIRAIQNDPSGEVVDSSINALSSFKYKAAVEGLIASFDADFDGKKAAKRASSPENFREEIATSLRLITGQTIGPDKLQWQKWWQEHGPTSDLK